jgi:RecJ-like exonuclease
MSTISKRVAAQWLEAAVSGPDACPNCRGTGFVNLGDCPECEGTGRNVSESAPTGLSISELYDKLIADAKANRMKKLPVNQILHLMQDSESISRHELSDRAQELLRMAPHLAEEDWRQLTRLLMRAYNAWGGM